MKYEWDVPVLDEITKEPVLDEEGNPMMQDPPPKYSLQELQDKVILKDTVNGKKYVDMEVEMKTAYLNGGDPPSKGDMKRKIGEIIPRDDKKIRDWLHGNPAEQHDLDVNGYLIDLMERDFSTFSKLGLNVDDHPEWDTNNIPGIQADEVPQKFKDELIKNVMDVKDLEITHDILTDIYAARGMNRVMGVEYKEGEDIPGGFVGNKPYNIEDDKILGMDDFNPNEVDIKNRAVTMTKLTSLSDPAILAKYDGWTKEAIAEDIGVDLNKGILNPVTKQMETIATYIANAQNKAATVKPTSNKKKKKKKTGNGNFDINDHGN